MIVWSQLNGNLATFSVTITIPCDIFHFRAMLDEKRRTFE